MIGDASASTRNRRIAKPHVKRELRIQIVGARLAARGDEIAVIPVGANQNSTDEHRLRVEFSRGTASTQPKFGHFAPADIDELLRDVYRQESGSELSSSVTRKLLFRYGDEAVARLAEWFARPNASIEAIGEAAAAIARLGGTTLETYALQLLLAMLTSSRAALREIALMGLDLLRDRRAVEPLRRAMEVETAGWLKRLYEPVIEGLSEEA